MLSRYSRFFENNVDYDPSSAQATQRGKITVKSYIKVAEYAKLILSDVRSVLDYGAGELMGTSVLQKTFPKAEVHSFEPYAKENIHPTYCSVKDVGCGFDLIVSLNVLNVLQEKDRYKAIKKIGSSLANEGIAIIGTRAWKGDISITKSGILGPESKSFFTRRGDIVTFQKGFDGNDLANEISFVLGSRYLVENKPGLAAKSSVVITKH